MMDKVSIKPLICCILSLFFILESTVGISGVANITFENPESYILNEKVLHNIVKVRVTDEIGNPVPFIAINFLCSDKEIADFIFSTTVTDANGLAVSIIQSQVSAETIISPPQEFEGRIPYVYAKSENVTSNEVPIKVWWGVICDPYFMGPYFENTFKSFIDNSVYKLSSLILHGDFVEVFFSYPLEEFNFGAYSTDSRIANADSIIIGWNKIILTINGFSEGITNIIVDGIPPAVISIRVIDSTKVDYSIVDLPKAPILKQNYPNPVNSITTIQFSIPYKTFVTLTVYNLIGQQVAELYNKLSQPGYYSINFDVNSFPNGTYIYRLQAGNSFEFKKLILLR
ncbi:MAG: T9SS type A sorting domain-containing protein [Mariniphaga sp.]|nr:T9SS type A sorting domain-containing protein [Mariniphaga sp.]